MICITKSAMMATVGYLIVSQRFSDRSCKNTHWGADPDPTKDPDWNTGCESIHFLFPGLVSSALGAFGRNTGHRAYLKYLSSNPFNATPWRASSRAISWTVSWMASRPFFLAQAARSNLPAVAPNSQCLADGHTASSLRAAARIRAAAAANRYPLWHFWKRQ